MHAVDRLEFCIQTLGFLHRDDAVLANPLHRLGDEIADLSVVVRRNGSYLRNLLLARGALGHLLQFSDDHRDGLVDAALDGHGIHPGRHALEPFGEDGLGQHGGGCGAVACYVGCLGSDLLDHLGAHVLDRIGQFHFLGNRHTILRYCGAAKLLVDDDVTALGTERHSNRIGELIDTLFQLRAGIDVEMQFLSCTH